MRGRFVVLGVLAATAIGLTTDQILQNVYDSTNLALRVNAVLGGGGGNTPTPAPTATPLTFGTNGVIPLFGATELGSYGGTTCATGFVTALSSGLAATCATPVPGAGQATPTVVPTATPQPTPTAISPAYRSVIYTGTAITTQLATSGNNFMGLGTSFGVSTTETARSGPFGIAVTVKNLSCIVSLAPTSPASWTATIRSGTCGSTLSDSTLTCTIVGNSSTITCTDGTHSLAISANQCASLNIVGTNTPAQASAYCSVEADY